MVDIDSSKLTENQQKQSRITIKLGILVKLTIYFFKSNPIPMSGLGVYTRICREQGSKGHT